MDLAKLNASTSIAERKPAIKLNSLPVNEPQKILSAKIVQSKFGQAVLLELTESVKFLPDRVTEDYKPFLQYFAEQNYSIVYEGAFETRSHSTNGFKIVEN
uniref:Uncharacterized protein LOC114341513 n=1 Tax=Diabrotica virgifera virgifera TaxID=50390 RepID=A0A6P7GWB2_DIAVI